MSESYSCAQAADKKQITGTLIGGSAKRLMSMGNYIGMPTTLTSANGDMLVTDLELVKTTTKEYWSKLYKRQETPNIPKPWLTTPSVVDVQKQVDTEPFHWPVPCNITDFCAMLQQGNHRPAPGPDECEK